MPRGGAHFSSEEVGVIHQIKSLSGGNRRAPKMVVVSDQGKFLLKRHLHDKDFILMICRNKENRMLMK